MAGIEERRRTAEEIIAYLRGKGYVKTRAEIDSRTGECRISMIHIDGGSLWINLRDLPPSVLAEFCNVYEEIHALAFGLLHQHRNPHHWQHWIIRQDRGKVKVLPMPDEFVREMVADWIGAGIAQGHGNDVLPWYEKNKGLMTLHPETRLKVESLLKTISVMGYDDN